MILHLTFYDKGLNFVQENLKEQSNIALTWFEKNLIKMNTDMCNRLISVNKSEQVWAQIAEYELW